MNLEALEKLDQLRKKGVLSDAEFQLEKTKLMGNRTATAAAKVEYNTPRFIGILSIVFGILGIAGTIILLSGNSIPNLDIIGISVIVQVLLYHLPLSISGIGIARGKNWGRTLGLTSALLGILLISIAWIPALRESSKGLYASMQDALMRFGNAESASKFATQIRTFAASYWLSYIFPILLLFFCLRKKKSGTGA